MSVKKAKAKKSKEVVIDIKELHKWYDSFHALKNAKVPICLGTDEAACDDTANLWGAMKVDETKIYENLQKERNL